MSDPSADDLADESPAALPVSSPDELPGADTIAAAAAGLTALALSLAVRPLVRLPELAQGWAWRAPPPAAEWGALVAALVAVALVAWGSVRVARALPEAPVAALGPAGAGVALVGVVLQVGFVVVDVESRLLELLITGLGGLPVLLALLLGATTLARTGAALSVWALRTLGALVLIRAVAELLVRVFLGDLVVAGLGEVVWGVVVADAALPLLGAPVLLLGARALRAG